MKIVAFVPIRLNSKRIVGKNLLQLGDRPLLSYIFECLLKVEEISEVYAFCSSDSIKSLLPDKVKFLKRDETLDSDTTLGQDIYDSFCKLVQSDIYILAHTTSPFLKSDSLKSALQYVLNGKNDSAFCAQRIRTFAWFKGVPLNYDLSYVPRTQDLEPIYVETSAFFIFTGAQWFTKKRRIGDSPHMQILDQIESIDIDNPDDFELAQIVIRSKIGGD
jgi:CMP-N-acetylneuraminic acid synthetase